MESLWIELRHAIRDLARTPWTAIAIVASIGLGVGANATVFAWLDNIVLNPFPAVPDGGALVAINLADQGGRVRGMSPVAKLALDDWRSGVTAFGGIAAHAAARLNLRSESAAGGEPVWAEIVSEHFFETLRVDASRGRVFTAADAATHAAVVVVGHAFWQQRLGGAEVLGRSLLLNGVPLTVVGIAPPRFGGVVMGLAFDVWVPLWQQPALTKGGDWNRDRRLRRLQAVARLRPGVNLAAANQELLAVATNVSRASGETPITGAGARWIRDTQLGSLMGPLSAAMIVVTGAVLLAACANVAGLLFARAASRRRHTAIRVALGASRGRLIAAALAQIAMLAAAGGAVGLLMAQAAKGVLTLFVPVVALPVSLQIDLNWRVMLFAMASAAAAGLLCGVIPAYRAARPDVVGALKSSGPGPGIGRARLRPALVVLQVSFSIVALSLAGLFLRSVLAAAEVPLGFSDPSHVLVTSTDLTFTGLNDESRDITVDRMLEKIRTLPGVAAASVASVAPLGFGGAPTANTRVEGYTPAPGESMFVGRVIVSDGYFSTMQIAIAEGRALDAEDRSASRRVAVVNEAFVARFLAGSSARGRRVDQGNGWSEIVGVATNARMDSLSDPVEPLIYHSFAQVRPAAVTLHVRTEVNPMSLVTPIRRALAEVHPDLPLLDPATLADYMAAATFVQSVGSAVSGVAGLLAMVIAATGLYGLVAGAVAERRREIAVTVALGATPLAVVTRVARPSFQLTLIGAAVGGMISVVASTLLKSRLAGVSPVDPVALLGSVGVLLLVAAATCILPAWRAARIDPAMALGAE